MRLVNPPSAVTSIDQKIGLAKHTAEIHARQKAMAHLLLGAIADSRRQHAKALPQFEAALALDGNDSDALEYAGLQLLKMGKSARQLLTNFPLLAVFLPADRRSNRARARGEM